MKQTELEKARRGNTERDGRNDYKQLFKDITRMVARETIRKVADSHAAMEESIEIRDFRKQTVRERAELLVKLISLARGYLFSTKDFETESFIFYPRSGKLPVLTVTSLTYRKRIFNWLKKPFTYEVLVETKKPVKKKFLFFTYESRDYYRIQCRNEKCKRISESLEKKSELFDRLEREVLDFIKEKVLEIKSLEDLELKTLQQFIKTPVPAIQG
ncbi:MAG: hypothetical protein ACFFD4_12620 [Candidatus Odinarchaeota archaeon]